MHACSLLTGRLLLCCFFIFETKSYNVALTGLELTTESRLDLEFTEVCLLTSQVLELKVYATIDMSGSLIFFKQGHPIFLLLWALTDT